MATILDVAKQAGVSVKTVSRVLNDHENVSEETRAAVYEAMRALNYRPNDAARQLRGQTSPNVGLLLGDPASGYQARFHQALLAACLQAGRYLCVELFDAPGPGWGERVRVLLERTGIGDMILLPPLCDFLPLKTLLREQGVRIALISPASPDPQSSAILMDDRAAAAEITGFLLDQGHRRIGHITGNPDHAATGLRRNGFIDAFIARGLARPDPELIVEGNFLFKRGSAAAEQLLDVARPPSAIFAANDDTAAAVCMVAHRLGLRIPEDLSVVGFDDSPIASEIWPSLTTVRQPFAAMAAAALKALALTPRGAREGHAAPAFLEPYSLVFRESSGPLRLREERMTTRDS
ncbi:MAG TPA: LacI family DNA-binding transcriptional regulator [Caulobacterales bacterium]|nr:LacI family DNA-binding transcriptional regulator [Caulobacterales bacterium]